MATSIARHATRKTEFAECRGRVQQKREDQSTKSMGFMTSGRGHSSRSNQTVSSQPLRAKCPHPGTLHTAVLGAEGITVPNVWGQSGTASNASTNVRTKCAPDM